MPDHEDSTQPQPQLQSGQQLPAAQQVPAQQQAPAPTDGNQAPAPAEHLKVAAPPTIGERIGKEIVVAMKARDEHRLTTLRMVKSALKNREIDKRQPLTDAEETQVLSTLLKQRRESVESFTKGDRPELAEKEKLEIGMIESFLPQAAGEDEIRTIVQGAIAHLTADAGGTRPGPRDMGPAMRVVQQRLLAAGIRAEGKLVSDLVKAELAG